MRGLSAIAASILIMFASADDDSDDLRPRVDQRVREWWPKPSEKQFDQIGWAPDLSTARRLAAEHDRPIFLITMDGRVNLGRC
jgi:hypothetical protein